ncbi:MAG: tRNA (adenosine(37)-N6)-threonylcarbamoyltransferase complex dimerization subunit type 1 TsaB [Acidiferrobacteraceae bacterium]
MALQLLAIETSQDVCSVALFTAGGLVARSEHTPRGHALRLLPMVDEVLAEAGVGLRALDAIAYGQGPGSFTGLRIAAAATQGLAFGADRPVVAVSTLASLAQALDAPRCAIAVDARMDQVYFGAYSRDADGIPALVGREQVAAPEDVQIPAGDQQWQGGGSGWDRYADRLRLRLGAGVSAWLPQLFPDARHLIPIALVYWKRGRAVAAHEALPVYLRNDVAKRSSERNK